MAVPIGFKSIAEYKQYCRCFNKIVPGDSVEVYTTSWGNFAESPRPFHKTFKVIGRRLEQIMIGARGDEDRQYMWDARESPHYFAELTSKVEDINQYLYGYWIWTPPNVRIKRVIRSPQVVKPVDENAKLYSNLGPIERINVRAINW